MVVVAEPSPFIRITAASTGASAACAAEIFQNFRVEDRGADLVDAHGPLTQVNFAAAIAAEREIPVCKLHQHSAGWAFMEFRGFFLRSHGKQNRQEICYRVVEPFRETASTGRTEGAGASTRLNSSGLNSEVFSRESIH
jgi:hypothetical protein